MPKQLRYTGPHDEVVVPNGGPDGADVVVQQGASGTFSDAVAKSLSEQETWGGSKSTAKSEE